MDIDKWKQAINEYLKDMPWVDSLSSVRMQSSFARGSSHIASARRRVTLIRR